MFSSNPQIEHFSTVLLLPLMNKLYEEYIGGDGIFQSIDIQG